MLASGLRLDSFQGLVEFLACEVADTSTFNVCSGHLSFRNTHLFSIVLGQQPFRCLDPPFADLRHGPV